MANKPINELDFAAIKDQFIAFLRNQTQFKDYDFTGSNMNVILDVLSYNTYKNNFYTNMAINEMFLDSAVIKNSVVSHAKELNYLPRSRTSAKAIVNVSIRDTAETGQTITIPRFTRFNSNVRNSNFTFITNETYVARRTGIDTFVATDVEIYEGEVLNGFERESFFIEEENLFRCVLTNENIDIRTIEVFVDSEATDEQNQFFYAPDIFGVQPNGKVFYLEPYFDDRYAVYFGRNRFGEQPGPNTDVKIQYRICNGEEPNGASRFATSFRPNVTVTTVQSAVGGSERENIDNIKFFAPKSIQIQERAITSSDYEILLRQRFPEIQAVAAYGGDELDPPQFGRVAVSVSLQGEATLSTTLKNEYVRYLSDKSPLTIEPIFVDPEFLYSETIVDVNYSRKLTTKSKQELESLIRAAIQNFSTTKLSDFGSVLRSSRLSAMIDSIDEGILSNSLCVNPIIQYSPPLGLNLNPRFRFESALVKPYPFRAANGFDNFKPAVTSTTFNFKRIPARLQDDGSGNMMIVSADRTNTEILDPTIGTIDYENGDIKLINFSIDSFAGSAIKIYAATRSVDIQSPKSRILKIRDEDVVVNFIETDK
jgi:hypothetical protein